MIRWMVACALAALLAAPARAQAPAAGALLRVQLNWTLDARFAGFVVARERGFYRALGLDVTLLPGGPDIRPSAAIRAGDADVAVDWLAEALAAREHGVSMVNIAQLQQVPALQLICRRDAHIASTADFPGHALGIWPNGRDLALRQLLAKLQMRSDGRAGGVSLVPQGAGVEALSDGRLPCVSAMGYADFWNLLDQGQTPQSLTVFDFRTEGVGLPEDGLYVSERRLDQPAFVARLARFIGATTHGWVWAMSNPMEAASLFAAEGSGGNLDEQARMLIEYGKLMSDGSTPMLYFRPDSYEAAVSLMMATKQAPIIEKHPTRALTSAVWQASRAYENGAPAR